MQCSSMLRIRRTHFWVYLVLSASTHVKVLVLVLFTYKMVPDNIFCAAQWTQSLPPFQWTGLPCLMRAPYIYFTSTSDSIHWDSVAWFPNSASTQWSSWRALCISPGSLFDSDQGEGTSSWWWKLPGSKSERPWGESSIPALWHVSKDCGWPRVYCRGFLIS